MGRTKKVVYDADGLDRRDLGYYSTPSFLAEYLAERMLQLRPRASTVFDPCIGKGEMTEPFARRGIRVRGMDIMNHGVRHEASFDMQDFIGSYAEQVQGLFRQQCDEDLIVLNPPYNCHEVDYIRSKKNLLSLAFPIGVHNMYAMFLSAVVTMAKEGALIGVLTADSFLTARHHEPLRRQILEECAVRELLLCPTDLFWEQDADVRTCLMILEKASTSLRNDEVRLLQRPPSMDAFIRTLKNSEFETRSLAEIVLLSDRDRSEITVGAPSELMSLFQHRRLGDAFPCVTGISTGDDKRYLSKQRRPGFTTPFYKNPASKKFYCDVQYYLDDRYLKLDQSVENFIVRNKRFMGQSGITCSSMGVAFSACLLPKDSTFGVNANIFAEDDTWWLMSYLNSPLVLYLLRGILNRSNMTTSGYVSRIPLPPLDRGARAKLTAIAQRAHASRGQDAQDAVSEIGMVIEEELALSPVACAVIRDFQRNVYRNS
jgi:hypothetical protein